MGQIMTLTNMVIAGFKHADKLRIDAKALVTPIYSGFTNRLILLDTAHTSTKIDDLTLSVIGPTQNNLDELHKDRLKWLEASEEAVAAADPLLMEKVDDIAPNLSSIVISAEADDKRILLTGDARGDHILQGLEQAQLLDSQGQIHLDVLKLPHHGSVRNLNRAFFKTILADTYVLSANGRDDNPDLATLIWIINAAKEREQLVNIVVTNETLSTTKLHEDMILTSIIIS